MIVFDLRCAGQGHVFEAWFGSGDDFEEQKARGLLSCPLCGDADIAKAVMAPAVPAKSNRAVAAPVTEPAVPVGTGIDPEKARAMIATLASAQAEMLKSSEWVGDRFATRARAMHYGEEEQRPIHGQVAPHEARSLIEEGVEVAPLPIPIVPPDAQN